jgi:hypothetical protein
MLFDYIVLTGKHTGTQEKPLMDPESVEKLLQTYQC